MTRVPTFFTADWHLGHANSIVFDNRPFADIKDMHRALIKRYNAQVPPDGICYFLGDIGVGSLEMTKEVLSKLNGTKIIVLGNHDRKRDAMIRAGFDAAINMASIVIQGELVTMTHCPLRGIHREDTTGMKGVTGNENWHGEGRHKDFSIPDWGQFHLHGHIHSPNGGKSKKISGRQMDVGVPANNYTPVSLSHIESWIVKTKKGELDGDS